MSWLQFNFLIPRNLFVHFEFWFNVASSKKISRGYCLIWLVYFGYLEAYE